MKNKSPICNCTDKCSDEKRAECGDLCNAMVGTATSHIVEPIQLQRDKRIEADRKIHDLEARDKKSIKRKKVSK